MHVTALWVRNLGGVSSNVGGAFPCIIVAVNVNEMTGMYTRRVAPTKGLSARITITSQFAQMKGFSDRIISDETSLSARRRSS